MKNLLKAKLENLKTKIINKTIGWVRTIIFLMIAYGILMIAYGILWLIGTITVGVYQEALPIIDPCEYNINYIATIELPFEGTFGYSYDHISFLTQKKDHCDKDIYISLGNTIALPKNFTGSIKVKITEIKGTTAYKGKVIGIKPIRPEN